MNGYRLLAQLLGAHMTDAAKELSDLLAEREERAARLKALEYELAWLIQYVHRVGVNATAVEKLEEEPVAWAKRAGVFHGADDQSVVVHGCPRLEAILDGRLPSLEAFTQGRTP